MFTKTQIILCTLLAAIAAPNIVRADASAPLASSSSSDILQTLKKNTSASYTFWLTGPKTNSFKALTGASADSGKNLTIDHILSLGYRLNPMFKVSIAQGFTQAINNTPQSVADDHFVANDPYVALSVGNLTNNEKFTFTTAFRYYVPVSRATRQAADTAKVTDAGRGAARAYLTPALALMDGKLNITGTAIVHYRLAQKSDAQRQEVNSNPKRQDFYFILDPAIAYSLSNKVEVYLEYATARMRHTTKQGGFFKGASWSKFSTLESVGQYFSPGINWSVSKKLLLNPYASVGPDFTGFKNVDLGLIATVTL